MIVISPFLIFDFNNLYNDYLSYTGAPDYGWVAIIKTVSALYGGTSINYAPIVSYLHQMLSVSKYIFFAAYFYLVFKMEKTSVADIEGILLIFLLFFNTGFNNDGEIASDSMVSEVKS